MPPKTFDHIDVLEEKMGFLESNLMELKSLVIEVPQALVEFSHTNQKRRIHLGSTWNTTKKERSIGSNMGSRGSLGEREPVLLSPSSKNSPMFFSGHGQTNKGHEVRDGWSSGTAHSSTHNRVPLASFMLNDRRPYGDKSRGI
ncbi:hypothetical protein VNO77_13249 [Canavalia gladiata]|uniref:Uncharacterized protein n=1 Tax=Canavalia gladiata TaxID=3824 RepID=A0AAN9LX57_CANGL